MYGLFLRDLDLTVSIGAHDFEHEAPQRLLINIDLALDHAPVLDALGDVTDYDFIRREIDRITGEGHIILQETLCRRILGACRDQPRVAAVRVTTAKTDVYPDAAAVGCRMIWFAEGCDRQAALLALG
jgi:dihydroneopterin aldolase